MLQPNHHTNQPIENKLGADFYRTFFDLSLGGILLEDKSGTILEVNKAICTLFGYSREELLGKNIRMLVPLHRHHEIEGHIAEILAGKTLQHEVENVAKDGSLRRIEVRETAILLSDGTQGILIAAEDMTERRKAENQLRILGHAMATTNELISITDTNDRFVYVNRASLDAYGYTEAELLGSTPAVLFSDRNSPELLGEILAGARGNGWNGEVLDRRKDGSEFYVYLNASPVRDDKGNILGLMGVARDITSQKLAAAALVESEERFRATFDQAAVGIAHIGRDGKFLRFNQQLCIMVGYSAAELITKTFQEITHPDDLDAYGAEVQKLFAGATSSYTIEKRCIHKEGTPIWISVTASIVRNEAQEVQYLVAIVVDITERKRAEEALRASEERFTKAFKLSPDPTVISRMVDGSIIDVNAAWEALYQHRREEAIGRTSLELNLYAKPQDRERLVSQIEQQGFVSDFEVDILRKSGELRHTSVSMGDIVIAGEKCLLSILRDLTDRKAAERRALRSQRLESIGTLAGGIAHDLNNALAPVVMGVNLLKDEYPAESELLDTIHRSAKRSAEMVRQLLTFARGANGARVPLQPAQLVEEMQKIIQGTFPKNIEFIITCDANLPVVLGDSTQLHQVLLNLCVNARDAMPNGGTITLQAQVKQIEAAFASSVPDAKPGSYVALEVRDTGTGIPTEIIDSIFDPFFTTKGHKGTGLGLSTVIGIVKGHGGFLQVSSEPARGSIFTAYLPADRAKAEIAIAANTKPGFRGREEMILLVDDEAAVREIGGAILRRLNFKVITASDGADGLKQVAAHQAELRAVITDFHMPHMDGLSFVRELRGLLPTIPIIVATGRMEEKALEEFKMLGIAAHLDKPFTEQQLAEELRPIFSTV
ncbi:MAG: hypothetical protein JWM68_5159 [Verrucomicrobiales bacterium]|nr:hypothetical protein [Verrucomicrobiales bacterium]